MKVRTALCPRPLSAGHWVNGDGVQAGEAFALWQSILDEQSVEGFQIGEADPLRRCRVITDVAVFVRIIALPFGGGFPCP